LPQITSTRRPQGVGAGSAEIAAPFQPKGGKPNGMLIQIVATVSPSVALPSTSSVVVPPPSATLPSGHWTRSDLMPVVLGAIELESTS